MEPDDSVRDAVPAPAGDRRDGAAEAGADDAGADEVGGRDGSAESQRPVEVGGADEQPESTGRRDHPERAGVQLTNDAPEAEPVQPTAGYQMSLFPTEAEQIAYIDTAESANDVPSAFSMFISQDDIDHILRTGGNADEARMKIAAEFSKQKPIEDRAAFLKNLYYGGNGLNTENGRFSAWYGGDGIHIANGDTARHLRSAQVVSWTDAAERVEELLDGGAFATNLEVTERPQAGTSTVRNFTRWKLPLVRIHPKNRRSQFMTTSGKSSSPAASPVSRSRSSMKPIPKCGRRNCSQRCVPVRCVCLWAAPSRWTLV